MTNLSPISLSFRASLSAFAENKAAWCGKTVSQIVSCKNPLLKIAAVFSIAVSLAGAIYYFRSSLFQQTQPPKEDESIDTKHSKRAPWTPIQRQIDRTTSLSDLNGAGNPKNDGKTDLSLPSNLARRSSLPGSIVVDQKDREPESNASSSSFSSSSSSSSGIPSLPSGPSSVSIDLGTYVEMEEAIREMESLFNEAYHNPSLLNDEQFHPKFMGLYNMFNDMNGKFFSEQKGAQNLFERVVKVHLEYALLLSMYEVFFKSLKDAKKQEKIGPNGIITQRGDGNCWLYSVIAGLEHLGHSQPHDHQTLRATVVDWMRNNLHDETLLSYLNDQFLGEEIVQIGSVTFHKEQKKRLLQQELESEQCTKDLYASEKRSEEFQLSKVKISDLNNQIARLDTFSIQDYLNDMAQDGCHGSGAELYALAQIVEVDINIYRHFRHLGKDIFRSDCDPPIHCKSPNGKINGKIFVALNLNADHFDHIVPSEVTTSGLLAASVAQENPSSSSSSSSSSN